MKDSTYPLLHITDLRPGDVCLMLGAGELSKLIAWIGDTIYSHAFLVYDERQLAEAALSGLRLYPLAERIADTREALILDVYRPSDRAGNALSPAQIKAMRDKTDEFLGRPYARNELAQMGIMAALRNKRADSEPVRLLMRIALNHLLKDDPKHMVCSEFVYRIQQDAAVEPAGMIRPTILVNPSAHLPLPKVDVPALWKELKALFKPARAGRGSSSAANGSGTGSADPSLPPGVQEAFKAPTTTHQHLDELIALVRAKHLPVAAPNNVLVVPDPNPKTILPLDLAASPSLRFIGRLARP